MIFQNRRIRYLAVFSALLVLWGLTVLLGIYLGSVQIAPKEVFEILFTGNAATSNAVIVKSIRIPRMLQATLLGGALAVSGYLLQLFFHNPIAGPYVLGISSGAKLTTALAMVWCTAAGMTMHAITMTAAAFCGSLLSMMVILAVSKRIRNMAVLIVCGVMIGYICSAITEFILLLSNDSNIINLHYWSQGSFAGSSMESVKLSAAIVLPVLFLTLLLSKSLGIYQLGEIYAENAGINIGRLRFCIILITGLLSGCVTALAGPISFVGIAVPHIVRRFPETGKPLAAIPACFLGGAVFTGLCDLAARTLAAPQELSISSITAVIGAPIVVILLLQKKNRRVDV